MEKNVSALSEHEVFMRDFIGCYKQQPVLWQQSHPQYRNRSERTEAYEIMVKKCCEYYPEVDEDFVKMKIDSMRSTFRKEWKKVLSSRENASNPEDLYKPSLWYFDLLLFTVSEDAVNGENQQDSVEVEEVSMLPNSEDGSHVKNPYWSREHSAILINLYKSHQCLYSRTHPHYKNKRKRNDAVKKVTEKLMAATGKYFNTDDVRKKISLIRGQFLYEYKKIKKSENAGETYNPSLWCFEMLSFLKDEYLCRRKAFTKTKDVNKNGLKIISSDESDDNLEIKKESDSSLSQESIHIIHSDLQHSTVEDDDIYDTIAKNLAHKMREMTEQQRSVANKIVRDVMYHGQMEQLTAHSRLSLDGS